jgi:hypothetical protein
VHAAPHDSRSQRLATGERDDRRGRAAHHALHSSRKDATFKPGLYGDGDASDDRSVHKWVIYVSNEDGDMLVVRAGPTYEHIATNSMGELLMATPALSDGVMYVRGALSLFAIGTKP